MMGLTPRQAEVLAVIKKLSRNSLSPSIQEIADALGIRSKSSVHNSVMKLIERGHLQHLPNRSRSLLVVEMGGSGDRQGLLAQIARRKGLTRDQLVRQAIDEFLERELRA